MVLRCVTFEVANTLVKLESPSYKVYRKPVVEALQHYRLPCPPDDVLRDAFARAAAQTSAALPHYGSGILEEREWWAVLIRSLLVEAGCTHATEDGEVCNLVFQRAYSSFGALDAWASAPAGAHAAMRHAKSSGCLVGAVCNTYFRYVDD